MKGDPGPYINDEGDVWVPRTVPWREARSVALTGVEHIYANERFAYVGKTDELLIGFARDCFCEEECYGGPADENGDATSFDECRVPAWHFRVEERP